MEFFEDDTGVSGDNAVRIYCTPEAINAYDQWVTYPMKSLYETDTFTTVSSIMRAFANDHLGDVEFPLRDFSIRITTPNRDEDDDFFVSVDPRNRNSWYDDLTRQVADALGVPAVTLADENNTLVNESNITHVIAHHNDTFVATETAVSPQTVSVKIDARITSSMPVDEQMRLYANELAQRIYDTNNKDELRQYTQDPHLAYNVAVAVSKQCGLDTILHISFGCHRKTFYERVASFVRAHVRNTVEALAKTNVAPAHLIRTFTKDFRDVSFAGWIQSAISPPAPVEEEESSASEDDELVGTSIDCEYATYSDSSDDEAPITANVLLKTFKNITKRSKYVTFKLERAVQEEKPKELSWVGNTKLEPGDIIHTFVHAVSESKGITLRKKEQKPPPTSVIIDFQMKNRRSPSADWVVVHTVEMLLPSKGSSPGTLFTVPLDDSLYRVVVNLRRPGYGALMSDEEGKYEFSVDPFGTKSASRRNYPITWEQIRSARYNQELREEHSIPEFTFHARLPTFAPFPFRAKKVGDIIDYFPPDKPQQLEDERQRTLAEQRSIGVDAFVKHIADIVKYKSYATTEVRAIIWAEANNREYKSTFLPEAKQEYDSEYTNVPVIIGDEYVHVLATKGVSVVVHPPIKRSDTVRVESRGKKAPPKPKIDWNEDFGGFESDGGSSEFTRAFGASSPPKQKPTSSINWNEDFGGFGTEESGFEEAAPDSPPRAASSVPVTPPSKKKKKPVIDWNEDFGGFDEAPPESLGARTVSIPPTTWSGVIDEKSASAFAMDPSRALAGGRPFQPIPLLPVQKKKAFVVRQTAPAPKTTTTTPAPTPAVSPPSKIPTRILALDETKLRANIQKWFQQAEILNDIVLVKREVPYSESTKQATADLEKKRQDYAQILVQILSIRDDDARVDALRDAYVSIEQVVGVISDSISALVRSEMLNWIDQVKVNIATMRDAPTTPLDEKDKFDDLIAEVNAQELSILPDTIPAELTIDEIKKIEDRARSLNGTFNTPTPSGAASSTPVEEEEQQVESRISISALFSQLNAEQQNVGESAVERVVDEAVSYVALAGASVTHAFDKVLYAVFRRNNTKYFGGVFVAGKRYLTVIPDKTRWDEILESIRGEQTEYIDFVNDYTFEIAPGTLFSHSRPVELTSLSGKNTIELKRTYNKIKQITVIQLFDRNGGTYSGTMDTNVYTQDYKIHTVKMDGWMGFSS